VEIHFLKGVTMKIVNMTPHAIVVDGLSHMVYEPCGTVARLDYESEELYALNGNIVERNVLVGHNLPEPVEGTLLIVSAVVLSAFPNRNDLIAPNTNKAKRNDKGHIVSVPGFVTN
jgi:hypothetical protein